MRAVKTILSISFLFLAVAVFAGDTEVSNELPDEIKNLDKKKILQPLGYFEPKYPEQASTISTKTSIWVKFKLRKSGTVDTADVVYCEKPNNGFEQSALQFDLKSTFRPIIRRRRVVRSWFYTEIIFARIENNSPPGTDSSSLQAKNSKLIDSNFIPVEVMPELIYKSRPAYPRRALQYGKGAVVQLRVLVSEKGDVLDVIALGNPSSLKSLEEFGFIKAALSGARKCKFRPAYQNGKPVKVWVSFPYEFILHR